jgi:hypothetical protein
MRPMQAAISRAVSHDENQASLSLAVSTGSSVDFEDRTRLKKRCVLSASGVGKEHEYRTDVKKEFHV